MSKKNSKLSVVVLSAFVSISLLTVTFPANAASDSEINQAIEDGIVWLAGQQNSTTGSWGSVSSYLVSETGLVVKKFEHYAMEKGYTSPFDPSYPYHTNVEKGLDYLLANAYTLSISTQLAGDPDTDGDGIGVYFDNLGSGHPIYQTGIALMVIVESMTPDRVVDVPGSAVNGWTYYDVAVDTMNYLAWAQADTNNGAYRGGWGYTPLDNGTGTNWSDNSISGYAVLGLAHAEAASPNGFSIVTPQFVKDELNIWVDYIQNDVDSDTNDGGSGYQIPTNWVNILKTGHLLFQMAFLGDTATTTRVTDAVDYLVRHWNDLDTSPGWKGIGFPSTVSHYQAMYTVMKGLEAFNFDTIDGIDWYDEFTDAIVAQQNSSGFWPRDVWAQSLNTSTVWALHTLEKITPIAPPTPGPGGVGGNILPVDKIGVLLPYIAMVFSAVALMAFAMIGSRYKKRRQI